MKEKKISKKKRIVIIAASICMIAAAAYGIYRWIVQSNMDEEVAKRESWAVETGELLSGNTQTKVNIYNAAKDAGIQIYQIIPQESERNSFSYYDLDVQSRLEQTLEDLKSEADYTIEAPLAVWNPYGTGSNGLYIYFEADDASGVSYTIHTEGGNYEDYTANANVSEGSQKEFLIIGLVPGERSEVTVRLTDEEGQVTDSTTFWVETPETISGYDVLLEKTDGTSTQPVTDGLYYTLGTQGYYGYMFFFDNDGVMRYEMLLDGYKADRVLMNGDQMICCVASDQIGQLNRLGQVTQLIDLDGYVMHHDFNWGADGQLIILATKENTFDDRVMDFVLGADLETGEVSELADLRNIFPDYYDMTEKVSSTSAFFWQAGTRDWIHVNIVDYKDDGSILLSSRETSTLIKIADIYENPELEYLIGDAAYWEETSYASYSYEKSGEFKDQYGQHTASFIESDDLEDGQYYIMMYNNNYYANSTRTDGYEPELDDSVSENLTDEEAVSQVYVYLVDENEKTYSLAWSFDVPYSSIVSSVQAYDGNFVINSGVANVFGEYDDTGNLIQSFEYECSFQGYRVMKDSFEGYWF